MHMQMRARALAYIVPLGAALDFGLLLGRHEQVDGRSLELQLARELAHL